MSDERRDRARVFKAWADIPAGRIPYGWSREKAIHVLAADVVALAAEVEQLREVKEAAQIVYREFHAGPPDRQYPEEAALRDALAVLGTKSAD